MTDGPWFHLEDLSEADVLAFARREVPEWIVDKAKELTTYDLSALLARPDDSPKASRVSSRSRTTGTRTATTAVAAKPARSRIASINGN